MLQIKPGCQARNQDLYIDSLRQKFESRSAKFQPKRFKTSPDKTNIYISPKIDKILKKFQSSNLRKEGEMSLESRCRLRQIKNCPVQGRHNRRWSQIQKDEYNLIKNEVSISKIESSLTKSSPKKSFPSLENSRTREIEIGLCLEKPETNYLCQPSYLSKEQWFAERLSLDFKDVLLGELRNRKKSFEPYPKPEGSPCSKPFNFSLKLPKLNSVSEEEEENSNSNTIDEGEEENIFCSRRLKKSQLKLKAYKMGEFAAVRRRRVKTIDYECTHQNPIAPWNNSNTVTKSQFY